MFLYESRALSTGFGGLRASWPLGPIWLENTENTAPAVLSALRHSKTPHLPYFGPLGAPRGCSRVPSRPLGRSKGLPQGLFDATWALKGAAQGSLRGHCELEKVARGSLRGPCALEMAAQGFLESTERLKWLPHGAFEGTMRSKWPPRVPHWALDMTFENAVRKICARLLLSSVTLHSAPYYTVHGYARVHTSIYIYIHILFPILIQYFY